MLKNLKDYLKKFNLIRRVLLIRYIYKSKEFFEYEENFFKLSSPGNLDPEKIVYNIQISDNSGLFALVLWSLNNAYYAKESGMTPFVYFTNKNSYYDAKYSSDHKIENVFSYYYSQKKLSNDGIKLDYKNVITPWRQYNHIIFNKIAKENPSIALQREDLIIKYTETFDEFFDYNDITKKKLKIDLDRLNVKTDFIAVHFRGTDYRFNLRNHPTFVNEESYFKKIDDLLLEHKDYPIFLATDDENSLEKFKQKYKNKLIYFKDTVRSSSKSLSVFESNSRDYHNYLSGYEVIRDTEMMSKAKYFVCGLSNVSIMTRILKLKNESDFEKLIIVSNEINFYGPKLIEVDSNFRKINKL